MIYQKKVDGFDWILDTSDGGIAATLYAANSKGAGFDYARERFFMNILNQTITEGMTCIDLGANIVK